jgi:hypothetical protein
MHLVQELRPGANNSQEMINALNNYLEWNTSSVKEIFQSLSKIAHPLEHAKGQITLAQYCVPFNVNFTVPSEVLEAGDALLYALPALSVRLVSRLTKMVNRVEAALDLPALVKLDLPEEKKNEGKKG